MKKQPQFDKLFVVLTCAVLLACFVYCIVFADDISAYENRPANKVHPFSLPQFLSGEYQDGLEDGLMDQMPLSETLKRLYHNTATTILTVLLEPVMEDKPEQYISFRGLKLYGGDYLCYDSKTVSDIQKGLEKRMAELNTAIAENRETEFYLYYIECDVDNNFETGEKSGIREYLFDNMDLPEERMDYLEVSDFDTYSRFFFRTDHHWNYEGAYEGYRDVARMMGIAEGELLQPLETLTVEQPLIGTKANSAGTDLMNEVFHAYRFDLPAMTTIVNGREEAYGTTFESYIGKTQGLSYAAYYGFDEGEVIFNTGREDKDNVLVLGNSYDNALLRPLSAHFGRLCAVDLRYYETDMGMEFDLDTYIRDNDIDRVLLIGDNSYFSGDLFMMGG